MNAVDRITKLAELSDLLDTNGEHEAADEVDLFMRRFAEENGIVIPQETLEGMLENVDEMNTSIEDTISFLQNQGYDVTKPQVEHEDVAASLLPMFQKLSKVADHLDMTGEKDGADLIDRFLHKYADPILPGEVDWKEEGDTEQSKRYDDRYHHNLLVNEPKRDQEKKDHKGPKQELGGGHALQTRHCPDHIGDQLARVGPGTYQCSRDGAIYNWETGFKTMDGEEVGGGSISNQTEMSTPYASPARIFDSRQNIINTIN